MSDFENYAAYEQFTINQDWAGICALNSVNLDSFGTKKELGVLPNYLEEGEVVFGLTSGLLKQSGTSNSSDWGTNTWLVVLTNERFLFLDHALLTKSVDTQSVRHDKVQAVSASQGLLLGKIQVDLGARVIMIDNCQKATVAIIADLANKWIRLEQKRASLAAQGASAARRTQEEASSRLVERQLHNQERIIALLEEIRDRLGR